MGDGYAIDGSAVAACTGCLVALGMDGAGAGLVAGLVVLFGRIGVTIWERRMAAATKREGDR